MSEQRFVEWACCLASVRQKLEGAMRLCLPTTAPARAPAPQGDQPLPRMVARDHLPLLRTLENRLYMLEAATIGTDVAWAIPLPAEPASTRPPSGPQGPRPARPGGE